MKEGYRSGMLLAVKKVQVGSKKPKKSAKWLCLCDCGNEKITSETSLHNKCIKSCGCAHFKNKCYVENLNYYEIVKKKINEKIYKDENGCWMWQGSLLGGKHRSNPYGQISFKKKNELVHRVSWIINRGDIKEGLKVCHKCDKPLCVNPDHLFLGTQKDNVKDAIEKGKFKERKIGKRRNKLNWDQVQEIKNLHSQGMTRKQLQDKFFVSQTCIAKILTGVSWNKDWTMEL